MKNKLRKMDAFMRNHKEAIFVAAGAMVAISYLVKNHNATQLETKKELWDAQSFLNGKGLLEEFYSNKS